jgi:hypothetical protein
VVRFVSEGLLVIESLKNDMEQQSAPESAASVLALNSIQAQYGKA